MKILFLAPQPFFEARGTPINVRNMVTALSRSGHEIDLVVYPHGQDVSIPNVTIKRVMKIPGVGKAPVGPSKAKLVYDMVMFLKTARLLAFNRYDVIHAVEESAFMAWALSMIFKAPYIFDMDSHISHQLEYSGFMKRSSRLLKLVNKIETSALKRATAVVTVCPQLTGVAKRIVPPGKVYQVEDIPQTFPPRPEGVTVEKLRDELGVPPSALVALYTGNLEKYQGIDLLLESVPGVAEDVPSVRFVIVGGDHGKVAEYRRMADRLGVAEQVVFTGAKPPGLMPVFHEMADILLSPRIEGENTPLKIYTYLATGKPIVATDLPTHTQLLSNDVALLAGAEKTQFSSAILLLLKGKSLRDSLGAAGKRFVEANYNFASFRYKIDRVYRDVLQTNDDKTLKRRNST